MIKRRFKQWLAFMLAASMSLSLMISGSGNVVHAAAASSVQSADDELPSHYNLNELGYVTTVKNQGYWGLCWGFASIAAAETSMLSEAGLTAEQFKEKYGWDFDLSERHLGWFVNTLLPTDDASMELYDNQGGEGGYIISDVDDTDSNQRLNTGGVMYNASILFSAGIGPTYERFVPYRGNNGTVLYLVTCTDGTIGTTTDLDVLSELGIEVESVEPYVYSNDDDWSVSEDLRQSTVAQLEESYILSATSPLEGDTYVYNEDIVNAAKRLIVSGKAVTVAYHAITSTAGESDEYAKQYYNTDTNAQYTSEYLEANHAVTIVGYDDNYSKENFAIQPEGDGAWIVKNSWGSDVGGFPDHYDYGDHGYFYLSYYDRSIYSMEAFDFDISNWSANQNKFLLNEYDYMPGEINLLYGSEDELYEANVFSLDKDEPGLLKHVSIITPMDDVDYTADIYILNDGFENPTDGTLVGTVSNHYDYTGYHRVSLPEAIYIPGGTSYSVVVTMKVDGVSIIGATCGYNEEGARAYGIINAVKSVVNKGESFLYKDGEWTDWSDTRKELIKEVNPSEADYIEVDNFPIKAFLSVTQGQIGDNLYYSISEDGNLSITGSGDMYDYTEKFLAPWYNESQFIKSITVDAGVTHIGNYAFYGCDSATEISFSGDAPSLGENCFGNLDGTIITYYNSETWSSLTNGLYGAKSLVWNAVDSALKP